MDFILVPPPGCSEENRIGEGVGSEGTRRDKRKLAFQTREHSLYFV